MQKDSDEESERKSFVQKEETRMREGRREKISATKNEEETDKEF